MKDKKNGTTVMIVVVLVLVLVLSIGGYFLTVRYSSAPPSAPRTNTAFAVYREKEN